MKTVNLRMFRGKEIYNTLGQIKKMFEGIYLVRSQSGRGNYTVSETPHGWVCQCPDHRYREVECKHIWAVKFFLKIKAKIRENHVIEPLTVQACPQCGSASIIGFGKRHNKYGEIQRYRCKDCKKRFSINLGFERMKASPQIITSAMQLYFTGESLRNVMQFLKLQGVKVSHVTVFKWINKYVALMNGYLEKVQTQVQVSDTWRADELYVKIKGDMKYLFAILDDETRFWIAQEVAETKYSHDARHVFQTAIKTMGMKPNTLITDGLQAYNEAYRRLIYQQHKHTKHVRHITLRGTHNNNKMERFNGEVRDREKVMRGLKRKDTKILQGYQIYHNYIRPHEALNGKTPSEACGLKVNGDNKWITLIQNASHHPTLNKDNDHPKS
jgi:transposase-like protein